MTEIDLCDLAKTYRDQLQLMEHDTRKRDTSSGKLKLPYSMYVSFQTEPRLKETGAVNVWETHRPSTDVIKNALNGEELDETDIEGSKDHGSMVIDLFCEFVNGHFTSEHSRTVFRTAIKYIDRKRRTVTFDISRDPESRWTLVHEIFEIQPDYDVSFIIEFLKFIKDYFEIDLDERAKGESTVMLEDEYAPVHIVCGSRSRKPQYITVLSELGLDLRAKTKSGQSAMSILARGEYFSYTVPDIELEKRYLHDTNLEYRAMCISLVHRLCRSYKDLVLEEDKNGLTPLGIAAGNKDLQIYDAMINAVNGKGHISVLVVMNLAMETVHGYSMSEVSHVLGKIKDFSAIVDAAPVSIKVTIDPDRFDDVGIYGNSKKLLRIARHVNKICSEKVVSTDA